MSVCTHRGCFYCNVPSTHGKRKTHLPNDIMHCSEKGHDTTTFVLIVAMNDDIGDIDTNRALSFVGYSNMHLAVSNVQYI